MNDKDARGLVLKRLYDVRHDVDYANQSTLQDLGLPPNVTWNILDQLNQQRMITWNPKRGGMGTIIAYMARIAADGVDVIEGSKASPIAITLDNRISVHGSQGVQIGGQGNVQNVTMDIEKLNSIIDSSDASQTEKEELKSLLKKLSENRLVQTAFKWWLGGGN